MITSRKFFWLFIAFIFINEFSQAQYNWELKKQSDNINIFTAVVPGSGLKAFKGETVVEGTSIEEIAAIILDFTNYKNLFPDVRECKLVKKTSDGFFIIYLVTDA